MLSLPLITPRAVSLASASKVNKQPLRRRFEPRKSMLYALKLFYGFPRAAGRFTMFFNFTVVASC
jgi:hypothetical protein